MPSPLLPAACGAAAALLLLLVSGCSAVFVAKPVGEKPHVLQPQKWEGVWLTSDQAPITVLVTNADKGELQIGAVEAKEGALKLTTETLLVRSVGNSLIVNHADTHDGRTLYSWSLVRINNEDDMLVWAPNVDKFRTLVRSGKLKGQARDNESVYLEELPDEMLAAIGNDTAEGLFAWQNPITLRRVKR
jgi:hypothetical protein